MKNLLIIENDNYFINQRLKEIDKDYFLVFNLDSKKYEVHVLGQKGGSYAFTIPYNSLDERTLILARKTRVENMDNIISEIDEENEKIFSSLIKQHVNLIKEVI